MKSLGTAVRKGSGTSIFLCWLAYTTAYMGRYSYASNITAIMDAFSVNHAQAGLVMTCFYLTYGAGQIVNGILCRYYHKRYVISMALVLSAAMNLVVFLGVPFAVIKYLWLLNGLLQSMLWPSLIGVMSETLESDKLGKGVIVMSSSTLAGTFLAYGVSALLALYDGWRGSFLLGAAIMTAAAVVWFLLYSRTFDKKAGYREPERMSETKLRTKDSLVVLVAMLGMLAVANNLIKDGVTTWVPSIIKERFGLHDSLSILLTLALPLLGVFGAAFNTVLGRKITSFISLSGLWYLITAACTGIVLLFLKTEYWGVVLAALAFISLCMYGVNNIITSMAPLYMRDRINSGLLAGLLNGCCYIGSTLSTYCLGYIADAFGWNGVFYLLLAACCCALGISVVYGLGQRR